MIGFLLIRLRHPDEDLSTFSKKLGMSPKYLWQSDDVLYRGGVVSSRRREESHWASEFRLFQPDGGIDFLNASGSMELQDRSLRDFKKRGGKIEFYFQLNGGENAFLRLSTETLVRVANLGGDLEVEIFPTLGLW